MCRYAARGRTCSRKGTFPCRGKGKGSLAQRAAPVSGARSQRGYSLLKRECPPGPPKEKRGGISISPRTPLKRHKSRGPGPRLWNPTTGGWPGARRHGRLIRPGALLPAAPGVFLAELRPRIWELGIHRGAKRTHFASLSAGAGWIKEKGGRMPSFQSVEKVRLELGFF